MDLLSRCQFLYDELKIASDDMNNIESILLTDIDPLQREKLLADEFDAALRMSGAYGDLMYALEKLEKERDGMRFYAKRVRMNASALVGEEHVNHDL